MKLSEVLQILVQLGLNKGTSGNASVRSEEGMIITPSGQAPEQITDDSLVNVRSDGQHEPGKKPSSEWRFHRDIYHVRPEIHAIVHTHSPYATILACMHQEIPPFHYMIALAGGNSIRCAPYALFGSQALSNAAIEALEDRKACLLANHGMIALGKNLDEAVSIALEVENLSHQYWHLLAMDQVHLLDEKQMQEVLNQFRGYGRWSDT